MIPLIIYNAVDILRKSIGGIEVEILDDKMIRSCTDNFSEVKEGYLGVHISIHVLDKYYRVFFKHDLAVDIFVYGQYIADDFIFSIIKNDFIRLVRKRKLEKIKEYE